jgi:hypothetical protein
MRLKKHGTAQLGLHGKHGRVEPFQMAGLKDAFVLLSQSEQFVSLRESGGNRFFDKQIESGLKQH